MEEAAEVEVEADDDAGQARGVAVAVAVAVAVLVLVLVADETLVAGVNDGGWENIVVGNVMECENVIVVKQIATVGQQAARTDAEESTVAAVAAFGGATEPPRDETGCMPAAAKATAVADGNTTVAHIPASGRTVASVEQDEAGRIPEQQRTVAEAAEEGCRVLTANARVLA